MSTVEVPVFPGPVAAAYLVGSAAIYGAGKDIDYIVLVGDAVSWASAAHGWQKSATYPDADFVSLRKEQFNLLVTDRTWLFDAFLTATDIMCKLASVVPQENKDLRVMLYELTRRLYKEEYDSSIR